MPRNRVPLYALHDVDEYLRSLHGASNSGELIFSPSMNRREKEIISFAEKRGISCKELGEQGFQSRAGEIFGAEIPKTLRHIVLFVPAEYVAGRNSGSDLWSLIDTDTISNPLILILDGITDPHNLGAIIRSAELMGVQAIVLPKKRSATVNDTVRKVSAGASNHLPVFYVPNLVRIIEQLKERGFWIYAADLGGQPPHKMKLNGKTVLVMGSEGKGPSNEVAKHSDEKITIPSTGHIDSFNVSVATGILLYEVRRQIQFNWD